MKNEQFNSSFFKPYTSSVPVLLLCGSRKKELFLWVNSVSLLIPRKRIREILNFGGCSASWKIRTSSSIQNRKEMFLVLVRLLRVLRNVPWFFFTQRKRAANATGSPSGGSRIESRGGQLPSPQPRGKATPFCKSFCKGVLFCAWRHRISEILFSSGRWGVAPHAETDGIRHPLASGFTIDLNEANSRFTLWINTTQLCTHELTCWAHASCVRKQGKNSWLWILFLYCHVLFYPGVLSRAPSGETLTRKISNKYDLPTYHHRKWQTSSSVV